MCKIIGITGKRGSGRKTAAWLLAKTLEELRKGTTYEKYKALYECWVKLVIIDESEATSTDHVVLDSFGEHILDQIKQFCPSLIEFDLHDESFTNTNYINPTTLDVMSVYPDNVVDAEYYAECVQHRGIPEDTWMTITDFILYFAHYVMKRSFGDSVWLNIARYTAQAMGTTDSRIYWDCKTQAELSYIDKEHGTIIEVRNADREEAGGYRDIKSLDPDFILDTTIGLHTCAETFWHIAKDIRLNKR